jgi:hypothetical protein
VTCEQLLGGNLLAAERGGGAGGSGGERRQMMSSPGLGQDGDDTTGWLVPVPQRWGLRRVRDVLRPLVRGLR